jgi:chemotaxis response regulator CheB
MSAHKTVMVVDDAAMMRAVLAQLLATAGRYDVVASCENGQQALDALARVEPDVILVDIEMPVMDGIEFLRRARVKTRARIVVLSGVAELGSKRAADARRLGADAVLEKPSGAVSPDLVARSGDAILGTLARIVT